MNGPTMPVMSSASVAFSGGGPRRQGGAGSHRLTLTWDTVTLTVETTDESVWRRLDGVRDPIRLRSFSVATATSAEAGQHDGAGADLEFVADDGPPAVERTLRGVRVTGSAAYWGGGERLACCVLQLLDQRRLRRGGLCFHGVAVAHGGRAVLLAGPSESGKTSTALSLLRRSRRPVSMLSNDHVLGQLTDTGNVVLTPNPDVSVALRSHALWLADREAYAALVGDPGTLVRHQRLRVPATELGAARASKEPVPLEAVVFVGVGTAPTFLAYPTPALRAGTALNADLAGRVRAGNLLPLEDDGGIGPRLPDLTDDAVDATVDAAVRAIVGGERAFDVRGPVDDIADHVADLLEVS